MEADWEVEIGPGTHAIDAFWAGWIDLRRQPERVAEVAEIAQFPALGHALLRINDPDSQLWTSKCDVWLLDDCDPDEMEAEPADAAFGQACYCDVLPRREEVFPTLESAEAWARSLVKQLRLQTSFCSRIDVILRQAIAGECEGFAATVYVVGCGASEEQAALALGSALTVAAEVLARNLVELDTAKPLQ